MPPAQSLGAVEWVISRAWCRFVRFDLGPVPRAQRARALELQLRQWSPFADTGRYVAWDGDDALVWAWDAARVREVQRASRLRRAKVIPESLLHVPRDDGPWLVSCMDGVEGQVWRDGVLVHSRWWPAPPQRGDWLSFQRDAGLPPGRQSLEVPEALPAGRLERPWAKPSETGFSAGWKNERVLVATAALVLAAATAWQLIELYKVRAAHAEGVARLEALEQRAEPVLSARGQALDALARIEALRGLDPYPDQLSVMAKVAESLPRDGTIIKEWDYRSGSLQFTVVSANPPVSSDYVKLFTGTGVFENVQAAPGPDGKTLAMKMTLPPHVHVVLQTPPAPPAGTAPPRAGKQRPQ